MIEKSCKKDIKIFVSNRIDKTSVQFDNNLFFPVRCGAIYDNQYVGSMAGDNIGDNISEKRFSYCELTVQYWAWKNIHADYYGLCHYRRYLSFSENDYSIGNSEHNNGCIDEAYLCSEAQNKYKLLEDEMRRQIESNDVIAMQPIKLKGISNYEAMRRSPDYHNIHDVDLMMSIIKDKYPHMVEAMNYYMYKCKYSWLYNCYIMRKEIFFEYNEFLFGVLNEVEKIIHNDNYSQQMYRTPGTLGERLWGIFLIYLEKQKKYKIKYNKLIFFENTNDEENVLPYFEENNIAIASNFNNNYVPQFSVFLESMIDNASEKNNYDIVILNQDISQDNKKILLSQVEDESNFNIRFVDSYRYIHDINIKVDNPNYSTDLFVRVLIPYILPNYEKILVVDADMICKEDIAQLYLEDVNDYIAGAVQDTVYMGYCNGMVKGTKKYTKEILQLDDPYTYCNTGTLLLNAKRFREKYDLKELKIAIGESKYKIYEQDMLNYLIRKEVKYLDPKWNVYTYTSDFIKECINCAPFDKKELYMEARKNPGIIHYAAHPKPWQECNSDMYQEFWFYARKSPFYELIISTMIRYISWIQCGHFNMLNKRRKQIIKNSYYRKFIEIREEKGVILAIKYCFDWAISKVGGGK